MRLGTATLLVALVATTLFGVPSAHASNPEYVFQDLGISTALDVNSAGVIAGVAEGAMFGRAVTWEAGTVTYVDGGGDAIASQANGINDAGLVAGRFVDTSSTAHAFTYENGTTTFLEAPPGSSQAYDVNTDRTVVGSVSDGPCCNLYAAKWVGAGGNAVRLDDPAPGATSSASAVNGSDVVVGSAVLPGASDLSAVEWSQAGAATILDGGFEASAATAINSSGEVAGWGRSPGENSADPVSWSGGAATVLPANGFGGLAHDINDAGDIVGEVGPGQQAARWRDGQMTTLESVTDLPSGWRLLQANAVNDAGVIAGVGALNGTPHAVMLIPFSLDTAEPVVTGTPDRAPNANGWYNAPVTIVWHAVDPAPSSGGVEDPPATVASVDGADVAYESPPVCDRAANCGVGRVVLSIDQTSPQVSVGAGAPLTGTATDALSGVDKVSVTYSSVLSGQDVVVDARLDCGPGRHSCRWTAERPAKSGLYRAQIVSFDAAGNSAGASANTLLWIVVL